MVKSRSRCNVVDKDKKLMAPTHQQFDFVRKLGVSKHLKRGLRSRVPAVVPSDRSYGRPRRHRLGSQGLGSGTVRGLFQSLSVWGPKGFGVRYPTVSGGFRENGPCPRSAPQEKWGGLGLGPGRSSGPARPRSETGKRTKLQTLDGRQTRNARPSFHKPAVHIHRNKDLLSPVPRSLGVPALDPGQWPYPKQ